MASVVIGKNATHKEREKGSMASVVKSRGSAGLSPLVLPSDIGPITMQAPSGRKSIHHCLLLKEPLIIFVGTLGFHRILVEKGCFRSYVLLRRNLK